MGNGKKSAGNASEDSERGVSLRVRQFVITPAAGKRLIARALASHPYVRRALGSGRIVIVAGTTNGYVAEEILKTLHREEEFSRGNFCRGITLPPGYKAPGNHRSEQETVFPGDVVLNNGVWDKGKTIFDVVDDLKEGDLVLKGANALDVERGRAAILIGHPKAGTIGAIFQAVVGRRVRLVLPVGLEKRVTGDLDGLAALLNAPGASGSRLLPVSGEVFTELDAIRLLVGAEAHLISAGGVCGAEGSVWLAVSGTAEQTDAAEKLLDGIAPERPFER